MNTTYAHHYPTEVASSSVGSIAQLLAPLFANQIFSGGFVLFLFGSISAALFPLWQDVKCWASRKIYMDVEISTHDPLFHWVQLYMSNKLAKKNHTHVRASTLSDEDRFPEYDETGRPRKRNQSKRNVNYQPRPGLFMFFHKTHLIWLRISEPSSGANLLHMGGGHGAQTANNQSMFLSTWGSDRSVFDSLFAEAKEMFMKTRQSLTSVWIASVQSHGPAGRGRWTTGKSRQRRLVDTVVLKDGQMESLLNDVREFFVSSAFYNNQGIPYRRGYLLYGPPGTGKTSTIMAIAGELGLNVCCCNVGASGMDDQVLSNLINSCPSDSIILLEDIDVAFATPTQQSTSDGISSLSPARKSESPLDRSSVTLSGLLNCIDGVGSADGTVFFMTTNHIDKLASALIRPGRIDAKFKVDYADESQVRRLFIKFFKDCHVPGDCFCGCKGQADICKRIEKLAIQFVDGIRERIGSLTTAELQGHFMSHRDQPEEAIATLPAFISQMREKDL